MSVPVILDASGQPLRGGQRTRYGARAFAGASIVHPDVARWTPPNYSPAAAMAGSRDLLVSRIHDLARNDGWASAALSRQVDSVIGSGWRPVGKADRESAWHQAGGGRRTGGSDRGRLRRVGQ